MLLRHSFYYIFARGMPGVLNFVALTLYTRLLAPEEFGRYALVLAGIALFEVVLFQWLRLVLARFLPAHRADPQDFLSGIVAIFVILASSASVIGAGLALLWPDPVWRRLLAMAVPLLIVQAWFQLNLTLSATQLAPGRYGRILASKSVLALLVGGSLAWIGLGAVAPLIGLLAGQGVSVLIFGLAAWRGVRPRWPQRGTLSAQLSYGLPLTLSFALGWVVSSSDRMIIKWMIDDAAVGIYAVGYDLAQQSLGLLLAIVNTAALPLAMQAREERGIDAARTQLGRNGELVVTIALASAVGLIVLAPELVAFLIGAEFRAGTTMVLPWIALGAAIAGIKAFHLDIAFQIGRATHWQIVTSGTAAFMNVAFNILLIPRYGILGAAYATVLAFLVASVVSGWLGKRAFDMPKFLPLALRGTAVAVTTGIGTKAVMLMVQGWIAVVLGLLVGGVCAFLAAIALNVAGLRTAIRENFAA